MVLRAVAGFGGDIGSTGVINFSSDTGLSRTAAATIAVGNGTAGDHSGTVKAGVFNANSGLSLLPSVIFGTDNTTGFYGPNAGAVAFAALTGDVFVNNSAGTFYANTARIGFSSGDPTVVAADTGISRIAAGVLGIGNGTQGDTTGRLALGAGTVSTPSIYLGGDTATGWYRSAANQWTWESGGTSAIMSLLAGQIRFAADAELGWNSSNGDSTGSVSDTGISRTAAATIAVGNGTQGNASGTVNASAYQSGGTQVVAARRTGYGTPTGNAQQGNWAAGAITLANLAAQVAQIQLDLRSHGLIGT